MQQFLNHLKSLALKYSGFKPLEFKPLEFKLPKFKPQGINFPELKLEECKLQRFKLQVITMALISQLGLKQLFPLSIRSQRLTQCYTATLLSSLYLTEQPQAIYIKYIYNLEVNSDFRAWGTD